MYRVTAANPATASENRIHSDDVARQHGFQGGLVPGVTVYAYVVHAVVAALGPEWVQHGSAGVRFRSPCYDGEKLDVSVAGDGALRVVSGQRECVTGWATVAPPGPGEVPAEVPPVAAAPNRADRPPASAAELAAGRVLGTVRLPDEPGYLERVGETSSLYLERGWVHPGLLLEGANRVLSANVVLPPWLHVESTVRHLRAVSLGEPVEVRARVADEWERKGHRFVRLDVGWVAGGDEAVALASHTAIWQLGGS